MKQSLGTVKAGDLVSVKEAGKLLKVSRQSVYRIAAGQAWKRLTVGSHRFFLRSEVLATPPALERMSAGGLRGAAIKAKRNRGK